MKYLTKARFFSPLLTRCAGALLALIFSSAALANPYKITVLATNISDYGGLGEWSFSAFFEGEKDRLLTIKEHIKNSKRIYSRMLNYND